jgi:hypothetical protein
MALDAGRSSLDTPFWQNHWEKNHRSPGFARMIEEGRAMLGQAKLALCFKSLRKRAHARDSEIHRPLCCANSPALAPRSEIFGRKCGVALGLQAGMCCEKASASPLASVFSTTNPALAQRINPVILVFLSVYIRAIRG